MGASSIPPSGQPDLNHQVRFSCQCHGEGYSVGTAMHRSAGHGPHYSCLIRSVKVDQRDVCLGTRSAAAHLATGD